MKRTASITLDEDFTHDCHVSKAWQDPRTGERMIRGVASGVLEDRDGERVSARAIQKMATQPTGGGAIKLTASHQQDWATEFGDVVTLAHDREHDELVIDAKLPPAGVDPIADKAWRAMTVEGKQLGFSIGGKLRKAYFELIDTAKGPDGRPRRRKVLDDILLKHVALTEKPSYRQSFAEAVAKSYTGPDADGLEVYEFDDVPVGKAKPDEDEPVDDQDPAPAPDPAADAPADPAPAAATAEAPAPGDPDGDAADPTAPDPQDADGDGDVSDAEANQDLPKATRHLACPHCGHEFAADLPGDDPSTDPSTDTTNPDDDAQARKSHQETDMDPMQETIEKIRALADDAVAKTEPDSDTEPEAPEVVEAPEVGKTADAEDEPMDDVLKLVAASHRHSEARIEKLAAETNAAIGEVNKAVTALAEALLRRPQGRQSKAAVLPHHGEVEKSATESDDVQKRIDDAPDLTSALKVLNEQTYGIR